LLDVKAPLNAAVEEIMEKKLEDIATVLSSSGDRKSKLLRRSYEYGGEGSI